MSLENALNALLEYGPMTAAELRAELYELMEQVETHHGCHWMAEVSSSDNIIYSEAEDWAERESGVILEPTIPDMCLTLQIDAIGNLGFSQRGEEDVVRFTLIFADDDDDWSKMVEAGDSYAEIDQSLGEAWDQLGDRPVLAMFWED